MQALPPSKLFTFDDFLVLAGDDRKADLIDGVIYPAGPETPAANQVFLQALGLLHGFVDARELGKVYGAKVAFRLAADQAPEPDLAFVRKERLAILKREFVAGPPDLAVEIVAPDSVDRDYRLKRKQYQNAGTPEYWILDDLREQITLLRLDARGCYRKMPAREGEFHSCVLPGFRLRPEWLWREPLPKIRDLLAGMLTG